MAGEVNSTTMRVVLHAVEEVSGRQFGPLLQTAGLGRFLTTLPPDDLTPAADGAELVQLFQTVYGMLGESCTRLFHRNCGVRFAAGIVASLWAPDVRRRRPAGEPAAQLGWFVQELAALAALSYSRLGIHEDGQAWYLTTEVCHTCLGIADAHAPLCASAETMYSLLGTDILGRPVRVVEVACAAMGAAHCIFALYKASAPDAWLTAATSA